MRTDVKIGIVLSAIAVGVAAYYFSQSGDEDVRIAGGAQLTEGESADKPVGATEKGKPAKKPGKKQPVKKPAAPQQAAKPPTQKPEPAATPPVVQKPPAQAARPKPLTTQSVAEGPGPAMKPPTPKQAATRPPRVTASAPTVDVSQTVARRADKRAGAKRVPQTLPARTDRPKQIAEADRAATPAKADRKPKENAKTHVLKEGETLSALAIQYYGSERYTQFLLDNNKGIGNPRSLRVGTRLRIPSVTDAKVRIPEKKASGKPGRGQYLVKKSDTFYAIAARTLGDGTRWPEIFEMNKETVGNSPRRLRAGLVLNLPKDASLPE